jgi:hypothetical protein
MLNYSFDFSLVQISSVVETTQQKTLSNNYGRIYRQISRALWTYFNECSYDVHTIYEQCFAALHIEFVIVYLDNVLIFSRAWE